MKNKISILIFLFLLTFPFKVFSLDTLSMKYFPLHKGDIFNYFVEITDRFGHYTYFSKVVITKDTIANNHVYYYCINFPYYGYYDGWMRTDSITGSLYMFYPVNTCPYYFQEKQVDSLSMNVGDSARTCGTIFSQYCSNIDTCTVFGLPGNYKSFNYSSSTYWSSVSQSKRFVKNIGFTFLYSYSWSYGYGNASRYVTLRGCKINGIVYGDTSTIGIRKIESSVPEKFFLLQNYPNPFNPSTNIKYQIINNEYISLKIFDIQGKEIETLVNEKQSPGTYEVTFDASQYPSGVYFYRLVSDGFTDTKKMILLK